MLKNYGNYFSLFQKIFEFLLVFTVWIAVYFVRFHIFDEKNAEQQEVFVKAGLILALITTYFYHKHSLYNSFRLEARRKEAFVLFKANVKSLVCFTVLLYFFADVRLSRLAIIGYFLSSNFVIIAYRMFFRSLLRSLRRNGKNLRYTILVGHGATMEEFVQKISGFKDSGIRFSGWYDSGGLHEKYKIPEIKNNFNEIRKNLKPDAIIVGYTGENSKKIDPFLKENYNDTAPFVILPDLSHSYLGYRVEYMADMPTLVVNQPDFSTIDIITKRAFDVVASGVGLLVISPFLATISILIRLESKGPILYGQERVGLDGHKFKMWKFRSMRTGAEFEDGDKPGWTVADDPRVTRLGKIIRATSIDELPQLWNVFVGDMSLVGPRPEREFYVEKFRHEVSAYMLRHKMKAGITGWAQINGWRGDTSIQKRVECDLY